MNSEDTIYIESLLIQGTAWLAALGWHVGSLAYLLSGSREQHSVRVRRRNVAGICWLLGCVAMVVHIIASYGLVYGWSHDAALRFTGDQSEAVVGIRAESGLYANFLFLACWSLMAIQLLRGKDLKGWLGMLAHAFLATIIFFATIVFEDGWVRYASIFGFVTLVFVFCIKHHQRPQCDQFG